jgi:hypothetical protein
MLQTQKFRELDAQMPLDRGIQIDGDVEKVKKLLKIFLALSKIHRKVFYYDFSLSIFC